MIRRSTLFACGMLLLFPAVGFAQNWTGAGDGVTWEDPANWASNPALPSGDTNITDLANVSLSSSQTINELDIVGDQSAGTAVLNHTAGTLSGGGWLKVGVDGGNNGTYNASGTAVTTGYTQVHAGSRNGDGVINLSGTSSLTHSQSVRLADDGANTLGTGTLNLSDSATINTGDDWAIGNVGTGVVNLSDNSVANVADRVNIGFNGTGTLNIDDNAALNANLLALGNGTGTSTVNMTGGSVTTNQWIAIGQGGSAGPSSYNQSGGVVDVNGDWLTIGENGTGTYNVSSNSVVDATDANGILVGREGSSTGLLEVTGSNAAISGGELRIGLRSQGTDTGANGEISWIADANGVTTIVSQDSTSFGMNADLTVDLTADTAFSTWTTTPTGALVDIAVLIDNVNNVSAGIAASTQMFAGQAEGSLVDIGGGQQAFLTYNGGADGNDIVLQAYINAIPEPTSATILALAGMGMMCRRRRN